MRKNWTLILPTLAASLAIAASAETPFRVIPIDPSPAFPAFVRSQDESGREGTDLFFSQDSSVIRLPLDASSGPGQQTIATLTPGAIRSLCVEGGILAFATTGRHFQVRDLRHGNALLFDTVFADFALAGIDIEAGKVYVALRSHGVGIFDTHAPGAYKTYSNIEGEIREVSARGNMLFASSRNSSRVYALVPDGDTLRIVGSYPSWDVTRLRIFGDSLYILSRDNPIPRSIVQIIALSTGDPLEVKSGIFGGGVFYDLAFRDSSLLAMDNYGLYRLDKEMVLKPEDTGLVATPILKAANLFSGKFLIQGDTLIAAESDYPATYLAFYNLSSPLLARFKPSNLPFRSSVARAAWLADGRKRRLPATMVSYPEILIRKAL